MDLYVVNSMILHLRYAILFAHQEINQFVDEVLVLRFGCEIDRMPYCSFFIYLFGRL